MIKGLAAPRGAFPLTIVAIFATFFVTWLAEDSIPFFPKSLQSTVVRCLDMDGRPSGAVVLDDFHAQWFARELRTADERPLFPASRGDRQTLRFAWIRSFDELVVVRTDTLPGGEVRLTARRMLFTGCAPGNPACRLERRLTAEERERVAEAQRAAFAAPPQDCAWGPDGSNWVMEESGRGRYRFAQRHSPRSGPVRDLGLVMLDLTGWHFDEVY